MEAFFPYFITILAAFACIFGVLLWSGAVSFEKWSVADATLLKGDFDNLEGVETEQECFSACSRAIYQGCTYTKDAGKNKNCQLFRTALCAFDNPKSKTVYSASSLGLDIESLKKSCQSPAVSSHS